MNIETLTNSGLVFDYFISSTTFTLPNYFFPARFSALKKEYIFLLMNEGKTPNKASVLLKKIYGEHIIAKSLSLDTASTKSINTDIYVYVHEYVVKVFIFSRFRDEFDVLKTEEENIIVHERSNHNIGKDYYDPEKYLGVGS